MVAPLVATSRIVKLGGYTRLCADDGVATINEASDMTHASTGLTRVRIGFLGVLLR
jgi:hypothetical protein